MKAGLVDLTVLTSEAVSTAAKSAALELGVNVAPYITLDAIIQVKENVISGAGIATASASDPEGESILYSLGGADAALFNID